MLNLIEFVFRYKTIILSAAIPCVFSIGYFKGYAEKAEASEKELLAESAKNYKNAISMILQKREEAEAIYAEYRKKAENAEKFRREELEKLSLADVRNPCAADSGRMPNADVARSPRTSGGAETRNPARTAEAANAEFLRRVKKTLAVGAECDALALKYNALLEICKK